jgi:hypothetical protein
METVYGVGPVEMAPGAECSVILVDGVGTECVYRLLGVAVPPHELKVERPPNVPPLETTHRDPAFVYFRLRDHVPFADSQGRPYYDQILRD